MLSQAEVNCTKMYLLSHYSSQIRDFRSLPQYSTESTEALHEQLKDAYGRWNWVDPADQILDTITSEHAIRIQELNN